jgi:hypothetical protein
MQLQPVRPGGGSARQRAAAAHGQDRRHLQPLQARGARRGARAGQGHRAAGQRRGHRTGQDRGRKDRRPADAPGAQRDGPRHRRARGARRARQAGAGHGGAERVPRVRQHRDPGQRRRWRPEPRARSWPRPSSAAWSSRAKPERCRHLRPDLRARLLDGRAGHQPVRPRRRHGRGQAQHHRAARQRGHRQQPGSAPPSRCACR